MNQQPWTESDKPEQRRWPAVLLVLGLSFIGVAIAGFWLWKQHAPAWVLAQAQDTVHARLGADLQARVELPDARTVVLHDLHLQRDDGALNVTATQVRLQPDLRQLMAGDLRFREVDVSNLNASIVKPAPAEKSESEAADGTSADRSTPPIRQLRALLSPRGQVRVTGARISGPGVEQPLLIETLSLYRTASGLRSEGQIQKGDGRASWSVDVQRDAQRAAGTLAIEAFPLDTLVAVFPELPWHQHESAQVDGQLALHADAEQALIVEGELQIRELWFAHDRIAEAPVGPLNLRMQGEAQWDAEAQLLHLRDSSVALNDTAVLVSGQLRPSLSDYAADLSLRLPETHCNEVVEAVPAAIWAPYEDFRLDGIMSGEMRLRLSADELKDTELDVRVDEGCRFVAVPEAAQLARFHGAFEHSAPAADGGELRFVTGPQTYRWVELEQISPFLIHAVLAHEDAGFFRHAGFADYAIETALQKNLERGRFAFGASTISMQLSKNLFLSRDKTLARKAREVLLTWWLESQLSKAQILALYLNVIQYGEDLYGIGPASQALFGVLPAQLTLAQSVYIATVLPSPTRYHQRDAAYGQLRESTAAKMAFLLRHMARKGRITEVARDRALAEIAEFRFSPGRYAWAPADTAALPLPTPSIPSTDRRVRQRTWWGG